MQFQWISVSGKKNFKTIHIFTTVVIAFKCLSRLTYLVGIAQLKSWHFDTSKCLWTDLDSMSICSLASLPVAVGVDTTLNFIETRCQKKYWNYNKFIEVNQKHDSQRTNCLKLVTSHKQARRYWGQMQHFFLVINLPFCLCKHSTFEFIRSILLFYFGVYCLSASLA